MLPSPSSESKLAAVCLVIYWHDNTLFGLVGYPFHKAFISLLKYEKDSSDPVKSNLWLDHNTAISLVLQAAGCGLRGQPVPVAVVRHHQPRTLQGDRDQRHGDQDELHHRLPLLSGQ